MFPIEILTPSGFGRVGVVRLEQPGRPVVVLDLDLIRRLEATLRTLPRDLAGLVLASASERVFVAGADLKAISEWDDDQLLKYLEYAAGVFGMLPRLPFPTAAAINGAVLGGGLELALHCDCLAGLDPGAGGAGGRPYPVGLPEAGLGLCPGWGGTNLLPARMDPGEAIRLAAAGETMTFHQAAANNLFDEIATSADRLIETAVTCLRRLPASRVRERAADGMPYRWIGRPESAPGALAALDAVRPELPRTPSAEAVAEAVEAGLRRGWGAAVDVERRRLTALRHTPGARAALEAFFSKKK